MLNVMKHLFSCCFSPFSHFTSLFLASLLSSEASSISVPGRMLCTTTKGRTVGSAGECSEGETRRRGADDWTGRARRRGGPQRCGMGVWCVRARVAARCRRTTRRESLFAGLRAAARRTRRDSEADCTPAAPSFCSCCSLNHTGPGTNRTTTLLPPPPPLASVCLAASGVLPRSRVREWMSKRKRVGEDLAAVVPTLPMTGALDQAGLEALGLAQEQARRREVRGAEGDAQVQRANTAGAAYEPKRLTWPCSKFKLRGLPVGARGVTPD